MEYLLSKSMNNNRLRRAACGTLAVVFAIALALSQAISLPLAAAASSDGYSVKLLEDFEKCTVGDTYVSSADNTNVNYYGTESLILVEGNAGSVSGNRSLRLFNCDIRWQGLSIEDLSFRVGFSVKVGRDFNNEMKFMISTQDSLTSTESDGGTLLTIRNGPAGNTYLYGSDNTNLFELKKDTVYKITVEIARGKNECSLKINGENAGTTFKFKSAVYCINGMRIYIPKIVQQPSATHAVSTPLPELTPSDFTEIKSGSPEATIAPEETAGPVATDDISATPSDTESGTHYPDASSEPTAENKYADPTNDNTLLIDDIFISTKGREFPQTYSIQRPGEMPNVEVNTELPDSKVRVYVNSKEIDMSKTFVTDNTVYISAEQFLKGISMEYVYDKNERILTVNDNKVTVTARVPGTEVTVNGKPLTLKYPVRTIDDVIMISPNFINEVFNAKVWWDRDAKMLVVTSGSQKNDDILRLVGDKFYMNGEPYYEISFNKYDLFHQIWASYSNDSAYPADSLRYEAAEAAVKQLSENGFRSIRVFCSSDIPDLMYDAVIKGKYYEAMDRMFDLCDKYDIKVVVSLGLISDNFVAKQKVDGYGLVNKSESILDLVADENSESRRVLSQYIREFVDRYRSRKTVLMYEITNEGNLEADVGNTTRKVTFSLGQLADFYKFCGDIIRSADNSRIVTGGDSVLRNAQYNLFAGTMAGRLTDDWTTDDSYGRLYALTLLNYGTDVISGHTYGLGTLDSGIYYQSDGVNEYYGFDRVMEESRMIGKPFYNGESQVLKSASSPEYAKEAAKYLDKIIDAGVQITHWWTFRSDRQGFDDGFGWRNDSGEIFETLVLANRKLVSKYVVNGVEAENTFLAGWKPEDEIIDPEKIVSGVQASRETSNLDAIKWSLIIAAALIAVCAGAVVFFRLRMKNGSGKAKK